MKQKQKQPDEERSQGLEIFGRRVSHVYVLAAIFFIALALRIAFIYDLDECVLFRQLTVDSASYDQWAQRIVAGDWLGDQPFYQDPLYPYFLAIIYSLFGRNLVLVYGLQALIAAAAVFPMYGLGRRAFADPRVGFVAALFWATYKVGFFFDAQILKTGPGMALAIFSLWLLLVLRDRPGGLVGAAAGLVAGLLCVFRGNYLAVVPVLFAWLAFTLYRESGRASWRPLGAFALACVFVLGAITARNYVVSGELVVTTAQGGVNFFVGNYRGNEWGAGHDPAWARRTPVFEQADFMAEAERRTGRDDLTPSQMSRFWFKEGLGEIAADPGLFVARLGRKTLLIANRHEVSDNVHYDFIRERYSWLLKSPLPGFWLAGPLGLAGMALALRRRRGILLALYVGAYVATLLATYVVARYRIPIVPALLVFAAYGCIAFFGLIKDRDRKGLALFVVVLAFAFALSFPQWRPPSFDVSWQKLGHAYSKEGKMEDAIAAYETSLAINPRSGQAWLGLGMAFESRLRLGDALAAYEKAVEHDPAFAPGHLLWARSLERAGNAGQALDEYRRALELEPSLAEAEAGVRRLSH